jgi:tRNA pseudouridine55 synthase
MSSINGVLPVDKPTGPTSHDVVATARRALRERRIGHTGTLDPFASGLLLLCLGTATRLAEYLIALPKSYTATLILGVATDTDDRQGDVVARSEAWRGLGVHQVADALRAHQGDLLQVPPAYSAKRVAGERMYDVARRGEHVELPAVPVTISRIALLRFEPPEVDFLVDCSSGTYIRSIARDVGHTLGVGAHLSCLRRTRIGRWSVDEALPVAALEDRDGVRRALVPPAAAVEDFPRQILDEPETSALRQGRAVPARIAPSPGPVALLSGTGELLAIGEHRGARIQPRKVFG